MWADIPILPPGYQASDQGIIQGPRKELSQWPDERGYMRVKANGKPHAVHLLMLSAFVGERPPGAEPWWRNGDVADNRLINLRWRVPGETEVQVRVNRCRNNHVYSRENTKYWGSGHRICLDCENGLPPVTTLPDII